ncbi:MAG: M15 family metallopeptidase [Ilumatobacteraceae bacterium]|jgi:peptidoglycan L-alanyl-D-glutamate endopeptidase CwlK
MFALSERSKQRLVGVDQKLVDVVNLAIEYTKIDFGVTQGLRTPEEQKKLVESGASQTMNSKHITGKAVDLAAYIDGRLSWELNVYDDIADAMKQAAIEKNVGLRWGAAWNVPDIRMWRGTMEEAMMYYIDFCRRENKRPFIDAPHFELS